jgi:hypothetical protein
LFRNFEHEEKSCHLPEIFKNTLQNQITVLSGLGNSTSIQLKIPVLTSLLLWVRLKKPLHRTHQGMNRENQPL